MNCLGCHDPLAEGATECATCGLPVPAHDRLVGRVVGGRYKLQAALGMGGMGVVYRAEHVQLHKEFAVKLLHAEFSPESEAARRFEREAEAASRLDHPHIIQVTDFGTDEGMLYLVMELLQGETLTTRIARGRLAPSEAVRILGQVLRALERAHALGVVHRDLKPDNVFLARRDGEDVVKLLDFGIARMLDPDGASQREPLTQQGMVFGTPEYLSPEQAIGDPADGRADLYAAGVMLYEMLAGVRPFVADSRIALMSQHLTKTPPPLAGRCPEAGIALEAVVMRALEKKREDRFPTAAEFRDALERALPSETAVRRGGEVEQVVRRAIWRARGVAREGFFAAVRTLERRGVPRATLVVEALCALPVLLLVIGVGVLRASSPPPHPMAPPPAIVLSLQRVEDSLARGDLPSARAALQQELSAHPDVARVHYLLGNLHFAEGNRGQVPADYQRALQLDPGYRADPALLANLRSLLDDKTLGKPALALLVDQVGVSAVPQLADCARICREPSLRAAAAEAVGKLGKGSLPHAEYVEMELARLTDVLENGKTCKDRRAAVAPLEELGDKRALPALKRARDRRGGLFAGWERINSCMQRELGDAITALESE